MLSDIVLFKEPTDSSQRRMIIMTKGSSDQQPETQPALLVVYLVHLDANDPAPVSAADQTYPDEVRYKGREILTNQTWQRQARKPGPA